MNNNNSTLARIADTKSRLIEVLQSESNITKACIKADCSPRTYYNYIAQDETFKAEAMASLELSRSARIDKLESALIDNALPTVDDDGNVKPGNVVAQIFALKALSRQSANSDRVWSDQPPQETTTPTNDTPKKEDNIKSLLDDYFKGMTPANTPSDITPPNSTKPSMSIEDSSNSKAKPSK